MLGECGDALVSAYSNKTYKSNHVDHCGVSRYEEEEGDLHCVRGSQIALTDMVHYEAGDEIIFWLLCA